MVTELLEGIHFVASVEAISLGAQAGIHPWILYDIISNAAGNSCPEGFPISILNIVLELQIGSTHLVVECDLYVVFGAA
ncbi:ketose-bisphosphate aldolase class-II family protein [Actinidia rufa]|uniref:Ketose-bisphosphate aldolase class-II family protein n=1 Tax=Actinidia rufa TaxID=165716 RepID=A0A7J0F9P7_9ERIC|nr:ketose-bisphosphate aldolase class-II family protein [Actinidia rufa]